MKSTELEPKNEQAEKSLKFLLCPDYSLVATTNQVLSTLHSFCGTGFGL